MTMTEQVLAQHAGRKTAAPGDNIWVDVDILMTHDVCGPGTIGIFRKQFGPNAKVWDPEKVVIIPDHYIFTNDQHAHRNIDVLRAFVKEQGLPYYYDVGTDKYKGVCHIALPEEGHTRPGEVLFGTDSHTCTAGAFGEFATGIGNTDAALIMGIGKLWVKVPETMRFEFQGPLPPYLMAKDLILHIIGDIRVAAATDRAYIGSCTGGKLNDFVAAATILKGRQVKTDTYIVPATTEVARGLGTTKLNGETLLEIFQRAGAKIAQGASCAACLGGPSDTFGRLNKSEVCVSTTNRNFPGRMGSKTAQVYLASPYTVAASAVTGTITDPREFLC